MEKTRKSLSKLVLHRETLLLLGSEELKRIAAAGATAICTEPCSQRTGCPTCLCTNGC